MARSEYSTLRGIAQKRLERLQEAGLAPQITLPKSRSLTPEQKAQYVQELKQFLSGATTVKEARKTPENIIVPRPGAIPKQTTKTELQKERRRERQREYRRRKVLAEIEAQDPEGYQHIQNAEKIGLTIETKNLRAFAEYVQFRLDAAISSTYYRILEDFAKIQEAATEKNRRNVGDLRRDFTRYMLDRDDLENTLTAYQSSRSNRWTYDADQFNSVWDAYIDEL